MKVVGKFLFSNSGTKLILSFLCSKSVSCRCSQKQSTKFFGAAAVTETGPQRKPQNTLLAALYTLESPILSISRTI